MGSRKKNIPLVSLMRKKLQVYTSLSLNDRIALKQHFFCEGRVRISIIDVLKNNAYRIQPGNELANRIANGYNWLSINRHTNP